MSAENDDPVEPGPERLSGRGTANAAAEALFRDVNEQLEGVQEAFAPLTGDVAVVCECADLTCIEQVAVPHADYERIRREGLFVVAAGHDRGEVDAVVEEHGEWQVVRKRPGAAATFADATDPRP